MEIKLVIFFPHIILHFYSLSVVLYQNSNVSSCWYLEVGFEIMLGIKSEVFNCGYGLSFETKSCKLTLQELDVTVKSVHVLQRNYTQNQNCGSFG